MKIAPRGHSSARVLLLGMGALSAMLLAPGRADAAYHEIVLSTFCSGTGCTGGATPFAGLLRDARGNFYGTTVGGGTGGGGGGGAAGGGTPGGGTVFELTPNAARTGWTQKTLYSFCTEANCADGQMPLDALIMDDRGRLYGTTETGGTGQGMEGGGGTVFELTPDATRTNWTEKVLHNFCQQASCVDGAFPSAGLFMDSSGALYSTTLEGGTNDAGTVFELRSDARRTAWTEKVLYSFCSEANCTDGMRPQAGLIQDRFGNFYSTTTSGGAATSGTVFELRHDRSESAWTEKVLYSFCVQPACPQHEVGSLGSVIADESGNLYGMTAGGGNDIGGGLVFELTPDATRTSWTERTLYTFCSQPDCIDGDRPTAALLRDRFGRLFGTTSFGGTNGGENNDNGGGGTIFELTPNRDRTVWTHTVIHSFCTESSCTDGDSPLSTLIMDRFGNLYGTNAATADQPGGTVFEFERVP